MYGRGNILMQLPLAYNIFSCQGYQLEFNYFSKRWQGAAATVNPVSQDTHKAFSEANEEPSVWGVLWEINIEDRPNLDTWGCRVSLQLRLQVHVYILNKKVQMQIMQHLYSKIINFLYELLYIQYIASYLVTYPYTIFMPPP